MNVYVPFCLHLNYLTWFGHVEHKIDADRITYFTAIGVEGRRPRGCPRSTPIFAEIWNEWRKNMKGQWVNPCLCRKWPL